MDRAAMESLLPFVRAMCVLAFVGLTTCLYLCWRFVRFVVTVVSRVRVRGGSTA